MKTVHVTSAIVAGILGTVAMTTLMYLAPLMGLPKMDLLYALGSVFPLPFSPYLMGGVVHLVIGVGLAMGYALLADPWLPGPRWARGALYSILPWVLGLVALGPMLMTAQTLLNLSPVAVHAANPCGVGSTPGSSKTILPQNPCAVAAPGSAVANPCQPPRPLTNPCAVSNPCGRTSSSVVTRNPCAPVNPCAAPAGEKRGMGPLLSLVAHLVYGGVVGLVYRSRPM